MLSVANLNLKDLFESFNGDTDIQKKHINNKGEFVITAGLSDNGVLGRSDIKAKIFQKNTITIDMFGFCFYRNFSYKLVTHARVFSLKFKFNCSECAGLFISNSLRYLKNLFGYENMCSWEKIKNFKIFLPTKNGEIDFEFMEKFITELESERISELEAYLTAAGLKDFILTDEEKFALENLNSCIWKKFLLKDLFEKKTVRGVPKKEENLTPNEQGFYMYGQNILRQYDYKILCDEKYLQIVDEKYPILAYASSVGEVGLIKENFYRSGDNGAFQGLFPKKKYSLKIMLYFLTTLKIHFNQFNYDTSMADVMNLKIYLPTKDGEIDYEFMEKFITAVQKIIIADVVKYSEEKISAYRQAANK